MSDSENIRDLKRPYRKKALQSGYSQAGEAVDAAPLPISSYSTTTTQETSVVRPGVDPATYKRDVRPAVEVMDRSLAINFANYPWHLVPKANSGNVVLRQKYNFATSGSYNLNQGQYLDLVVLNVADVEGSDSWTEIAGAGTGYAPTPTTFTGQAPAPTVRAESVSAVAPPTASNNNKSLGGTFRSATTVGGGTTNANAVTGGSNTVGNAGDYYHISSFGHTEAGSDDNIFYQIWVDGSLYQEWNGFQWSAITPKADQWHFNMPIVVTQQIVFRVVNNSDPAANIVTGTCEACFTGWTEQRDYTQDVGRQQNVNTT